MREFIKKTILYSLSLFLVSIFFEGLKITGGWTSYVVIGFLLTLFSAIFGPFIRFVTAPFNILTLGLLSFLTTLVSIFLISLFYHNLYISSFSFSGGVFLGIHINKIYISGILSLVALSATIYFLNKIISWLLNAE